MQRSYLHPISLEYFRKIEQAGGTVQDKNSINNFVTCLSRIIDPQFWVCWPLRSTQNVGTGTTAFSFGGLGNYPGTLVNGPTWGLNGMTFNGVDNNLQVANFPKTLPTTIIFGVYFDSPSNSNIDFIHWATIPSLALSRGASGTIYSVSQTSPGSFPSSGVNATGDNQTWRHIGYSIKNNEIKFIRRNPAASSTTSSSLSQNTGLYSLNIGLGQVKGPLKLSTVLIINDIEVSTSQMSNISNVMGNTVDLGII